MYRWSWSKCTGSYGIRATCEPLLPGPYFTKNFTNELLSTFIKRCVKLAMYLSDILQNFSHIQISHLNARFCNNKNIKFSMWKSLWNYYILQYIYYVWLVQCHFAKFDNKFWVQFTEVIQKSSNHSEQPYRYSIRHQGKLLAAWWIQIDNFHKMSLWICAATASNALS